MTKTLRERYLNGAMQGSCVIFLTNGVKLRGCIDTYDDECIVFVRDDTSQLVERGAIATVMPIDHTGEPLKYDDVMPEFNEQNVVRKGGLRKIGK